MSKINFFIGCGLLAFSCFQEKATLSVDLLKSKDTVKTVVFGMVATIVDKIWESAGPWFNRNDAAGNHRFTLADKRHCEAGAFTQQHIKGGGEAPVANVGKLSPRLNKLLRI